ncbi:YunG family protein [Brevibacillus sp. TJ4]|uniref:YunG family protein n=1 Tax=Brevibacillus sp. TJ4 TaxID=3234853 RepID=UPI003BA332E8
MSVLQIQTERLKTMFFQSWSIQSSSLWTPENPAKGQCGVTSLVVHDLLGGEIRKTMLKEGWHFYNLIDGQRFDFTESQFAAPITYMDLPATREEAFADTNAQQYTFLKKRILDQWCDANH